MPTTKAGRLLPVFAAAIYCASSMAATIGGSQTDYSTIVLTAESGSVYFVGSTYSTDLIESRPSKTTQDSDVFVIKWDNDTQQAKSIFFIAGSGQDIARGAVVDASGDIYIAIETNSSDLPVTEDAYPYQGDWDGYITKITPTGNILTAAYLGGSGTDYAHAIAVDSLSNIYVVGETRSTDFPTTSNALTASCSEVGICNNANGFLSKIDNKLGQFSLVYSSYFGGQSYDSIHTIALDYLGRVHLGGETDSNDLPLSFPSYDRLQGEYDGFIALFDLGGEDNGLVYSSYLGGSGYDSVRRISVSDIGQTIATGETGSADFPVSGSPIAKFCAMEKLACNTPDRSHTDIFITMIDHVDHQQPYYSTLYGGSSDEAPTHIAWFKDQIYVSGITFSDDFATSLKATLSKRECGDQCAQKSSGFIMRLDPNKSGRGALTYSSYLSGYTNTSKITFGVRNEQLILLGEALSGSNNTEVLYSTTTDDFPADQLASPKPKRWWCCSIEFPSMLLGIFLMTLLRFIGRHKLFLVAKR
ncbi:MAG: SBBP repeat-containing protein [Gammaproteobacteria bacterium]|nr:SBBP repeat-containing protein [Gammaproteobacteria bacterium]